MLSRVAQLGAEGLDSAPGTEPTQEVAILGGSQDWVGDLEKQTWAQGVGGGCGVSTSLGATGRTGIEPLLGPLCSLWGNVSAAGVLVRLTEHCTGSAEFFCRTFSVHYLISYSQRLLGILVLSFYREWKLKSKEKKQLPRIP